MTRTALDQQLTSAQKTGQSTAIDIFSGMYLSGEFQGATGGSPEPLSWRLSAEYRAGFVKGVEDYFNRKFND